MKSDRIKIQQERQKEKDKKRHKNKEERKKQRIEKLSKRNTASLERQINDLKNKSFLSGLTPRQEVQLKDCQRDLDEIIRAKNKLGVEYKPMTFNDKRVKEKVNKKSIYYDTELNPSGDPPPGLPAIDYTSDLEGYETDDSVKNMPMPSNSYKQNQDQTQKQSQATYEAEPQLRNLQAQSTTAFTPSVLKKRKIG